MKPEEVKKVEDAPEIAEETKKEINDQTSSKEEQIEEKIKVIPETPDKVSKPILSVSKKRLMCSCTKLFTICTLRLHKLFFKVRQRQKPPTSKAQAQQPPIKFEFGSRPQGEASYFNKLKILFYTHYCFQDCPVNYSINVTEPTR